MRVPHTSAQPVGPLPGTGYKALQHDTILNAPKQQNATSAAFTAPVKNTAAILGGIDALADTGLKIANQLQEERDEAAARDALVALNKSYDTYAYGDRAEASEDSPQQNEAAISNGEYGRKGQEAFDAVTRGTDFFDKETTRLLKGLSRNAGRKFKEYSTRLRVSVLPGLARHEAAERRAYALQSLESHRDIEHRNAVANFTDAVRYNQFVAQKADIELQRAAKQGLPEDEALRTVAESVSGTLSEVFENQVKAGEFSLAEELFYDPRISEEKRTMLADSYRRARLQNELDGAKADPESARSRLAELRAGLGGEGAGTPLDFTEEDFAALENQIHAETRRREMEQEREIHLTVQQYESGFAYCLQTGNMDFVLDAEEKLLTLGKDVEAKRSRFARETYAQVLPALEASRNAGFMEMELAVENAFAPLLPSVSEEAAMGNMDALMSDYSPLDDSNSVQVAENTFGEGDMQIAARINRGPFSNKMREIMGRAGEVTEKDRERMAVSSLGTGQAPTPPDPNDKKAVKQYKEAENFRKQRIDFYSGDRPEQKADGVVWEAGQKNWKGNNPETRRYYVIGKRPLDGTGGNTGYDTLPGLAEHRQFISSDGQNNKGLFPDGFRAESPELEHQYDYHDAKRYDAELIEQAMLEVEKEMAAEAGGKKIYSVGSRNCQHYVDSVLKKAESIAKKQKKQLTL